MHTLSDLYKTWQYILGNFPRLTRYTLGTKIDLLFCDVLENMLLAAYTTKDGKLPILQRASVKFDALKFFLTLAWELKYIDTKKYVLLAPQLNDVGKNLGGWIMKAKEHS